MKNNRKSQLKENLNENYRVEKIMIRSIPRRPQFYRPIELSDSVDEMLDLELEKLHKLLRICNWLLL